MSLLLFNEYKKHNTPYLKSMTVFGQDVKILPNVYLVNRQIVNNDDEVLIKTSEW